ncbi:MAG: hypothetical protein ACOYIN_03225 [Christensenellales bacterium]|jgi:hypothetical protein|nr:hypothetical protein [Clostridia bacterium]
MKKAVIAILFVVALLFNAFGIMSLLTVAEIAPISFLGFYQNFRLIIRYIFIIASMMIGIMSFSTAAGMLKGKLKNFLSIACCAYSTILTLPLVYTFVGCFFAVNGTMLPMVEEIAVELMLIFPKPTIQYVVFSAGVLLGLIFLAVPIVTTAKTVKKR